MEVGLFEGGLVSGDPLVLEFNALAFPSQPLARYNSWSFVTWCSTLLHSFIKHNTYNYTFNKIFKCSHIVPLQQNLKSA